MNVIVLTNMYPTRERPSFGVFVKEQVEDLRAIGVNARVLAFDGSVRRSEYVRAASRIRAATAGGDVDLVHAHYGLTGAVALTQRRVPVVTTFHGSDASGHVRWQAAISRVVARRCTPIVVAPHLLERLGAKDATVIPAGVDTDLFRPQDRLAARRRLGWREEGYLALLPGARANPVKRADLFDAAVAYARNDLRTLEGVTLEGFSRDEVAHVMNAVDVTVLTSDSEGSPVTVRESLACNVPVVTVPVGDVPSLVDGLPGCGVAPRDAAAIGVLIAHAIRAGRSPQLRARTEGDSRPRVAARVAVVYETVLSRRS